MCAGGQGNLGSGLSCSAPDGGDLAVLPGTPRTSDVLQGGPGCGLRRARRDGWMGTGREWRTGGNAWAAEGGSTRSALAH